MKRRKTTTLYLGLHISLIGIANEEALDVLCTAIKNNIPSERLYREFCLHVTHPPISEDLQRIFAPKIRDTIDVLLINSNIVTFNIADALWVYSTPNYRDTIERLYKYTAPKTLVFPPIGMDSDWFQSEMGRQTIGTLLRQKNQIRVIYFSSKTNIGIVAGLEVARGLKNDKAAEIQIFDYPEEWDRIYPHFVDAMCIALDYHFYHPYFLIGHIFTPNFVNHAIRNFYLYVLCNHAIKQRISDDEFAANEQIGRPYVHTKPFRPAESDIYEPRYSAIDLEYINKGWCVNYRGILFLSALDLYQEASQSPKTQLLIAALIPNINERNLMYSDWIELIIPTYEPVILPVLEEWAARKQPAPSYFLPYLKYSSSKKK